MDLSSLAITKNFKVFSRISAEFILQKGDFIKRTITPPLLNTNNCSLVEFHSIVNKYNPNRLDI